MTEPIFNQLNSEQENLQQMGPVRKTQEITSFASATDITLKAPSSIVNSTDTGANIQYKCVDDTAYRTEYFAAGQEKMRRLVTGAGTGGIGTATTVTTVLVCES